MTRTHRTHPRSLWIIAAVLIYSFIVSLSPLPGNGTVQAALHANDIVKEKNSPAAVPTPPPSTAPSISPKPVSPEPPEPMPGMSPATAPMPTQGAPAPNMPNLSVLRNNEPEAPEARVAVPSTRCSPAEPDCKPDTGAPVPATQAMRTGRAVPTRQSPPSIWDLLRVRRDSQPQPEMEANHARPKGGRAASPLLRPQTGGSYDDFVMARLDPDNRIGVGAEDPLSRNFSWSLPLISMAGRSGLDLGLTLNYNSLVWTRAGSYITYDADNGYPTPGFRLGFPVIYGLHYNSQTGTYGYLMLMPSGKRIELRRVGATNLYESADSSYLQLTDNGGGILVVRSTDGTQLSYASTSNGYRCNQIKDRNGNYLTITHNSKGRITSVTDTLGRVFNFNYDTNNNLISITQTRGGSQYPCVTFGYTNITLQTNFTGLTIVGTQSGTTIPVLTQVVLPDNTYYKFSYNTWGQVYKVTNYAADSNLQLDNHALNYVSYNLPLNATTALTDCPRFTQRKDWAENWNNNNEAVTNYAVPASTSWTMPDGTPQSGTFSQVQTPDGVYQNFYSHSSGWDEGMMLLMDTWANNDQQTLTLQKRMTATYTQDSTSLPYISNPRVTETNIYDVAGNHRRIALTYTSFTLTYGSSTLTYYLPFETKEYGTDAATVIRLSQTDYNLGTAYTSRRILGLVSQKRVYDLVGGTALLSQTEFSYDENDGGAFLVQQGTPIQHDETNYGASFVVGRANLTSSVRRNVIDTSQALTSRIGYNTTGATILTRSPLQTSDTQQNIIYTDSFSDGQNRNTYAYPTEVTVKDTVESTPLTLISYKTQYDYDTSAITRKEGPPPAGQTLGAIQTITYDNIGRADRITDVATGWYTRWVYPTSSNVVQEYTAINDLQSETVSARLLDGAGRVRAVAAEHPSLADSTGGYVGQIIVYDVMGRVIQQSNQTEIYGSWEPAGDDAAGWVWSTQTYDWKGRPKVTTNQDGTTREFTYGGCGCAGGDVVTLRDEVNSYSKTYHDVLGRVVKTEELNLDQSIYRTTTTTYNALDQELRVRSYQGSFTSPRWQDTTKSYDGYGRVKTRSLPEHAAGAATTFDYYGDDTLQKVTDGRGATINYTYNNRHRVAGISYGVPTGSNIALPASISYKYDKVGNRTRMDDGLGYATYSYDQQSRMLSEARYLSEINLTFTLNYAYNLSGELTSISDPNDSQRDVSYSYNRAGRMTTVTAHGFANFSGSYASNLRYRATGALKHLTYGNTKNLDYQYNARLQVSRYEVQGVTGATFQYNGAAQPTLVEDLYNPITSTQLYDRSYSYDQVGRLTEARSGSEAHSQTVNPARPYREAFQYDEWDNPTSRTGQVWAEEVPPVAAVYTNNRRQGWTYDADGRPVLQDNLESKYDAAGHRYWTKDNLQRSHFSTGLTITQGYDGDGQRVSQQEYNRPKTYTIHSTPLGGQTVFEYGSYGGVWFKQMGFVYMGRELLALQRMSISGGSPHIEWTHTNPVTQSQRSTLLDGSKGELESELDPLGLDAGLAAPEPGDPPGGTGGSAPDVVFPRFGDILNGSTGCMMDHQMVSCDIAMGALEREDATIDDEAGKFEFGPFRRQRHLSLLLHASGDDPPSLPVFGEVRIVGTLPPIYTMNYGVMVEGQLLLYHTQKTACSMFIDLLLNTAASVEGGQAMVGRELAKWAGGSLKDAVEKNKGNVPSGFQEKYTTGGQNGFAMVHVAGVAGVTLIGDNYLVPILHSQWHGATTGTEAVKAQFAEDDKQLQEGLDRQNKGYKTTGADGPKKDAIAGYARDYPLDKYIAEKHAEKWDDGAGVIAGRILERLLNDKNYTQSQARAALSDLLCDK